MPQDPPYRRSNDEGDLPVDPNEGVRIIDPADAAEAVERGEVVRRKPSDQPRYGDRPSSPPDDVKPTLRFPLSDAAASEIERPRLAPVEPRGIEDFVTVEDTLDESDGGAPRDDEPGSYDAPASYDEPGSYDAPASYGEPGSYDAPASYDAPDPYDSTQAFEAPPAYDAPQTYDEPEAGYDEGYYDPPSGVISVEPATGETQLPHWTAPPTGEVPRVIIGDEDGDPDEEARWTSFASNSPRWRDEHDQYEAVDMSDLAAPEEDLTFSAEPDPLTQEEFLNFDDLDVPESQVGSASDPIRIQSSQPRAADPDSPPGPAPGQAPPPPPRTRQRRRPPAPPASSGGGRGPADVPPEHTDDVPPSGDRDVTQAAFVGIVLAAVAVVAFKLGPPFALFIVWVVVVVAAAEFFSALRRGGLRPATLLGLASVAALPLAAYWRGEGALPLVLFLTLGFTVLWFILGIGGSARPLPNTAVTLLGVFYVGFLGSFGALILDIPAEGVSILLLAVVSGVLYDVGGFFIGRQWGKTPLTAVSPNKTVEGLVGGMACSLVAAVILGQFVGPFDFKELVVLGVFVALAAPIGDLTESLFKRDLGLKDMGTLIPGHGGVLDRFDGLLFVLPVAYYIARVLL